jgi:uncharacterized spore protein YtfJ
MKSAIRHLLRSRSRFSDRIAGEPLEVGGWTIRPVVRVSGWRGAGGDGSAGGAGVRLRAEPEAVIIHERDGREHRVPTPDNTRLILWGLAGAALMVAVASQVVARVLR